jgi:hypothetical protein
MRWLVLLILAGVPMAASPAARATGDAIPAECATKTRIQPRTPGWAFVMNFDVLDGASPRGCLMLYRVVYVPTDFVPVTCSRIGAVSFNAGRGTFTGGYVTCDVNIQQKLAALTPPATVPAIDVYPYFTIVAAATFSTPVTSNAFSNPIGVYAPNTTIVPGLGLYAPVRSAQSPQMITLFNHVTSTSNIDIRIGPVYTLTVEHDGGPDVFTTTHYLSNTIAGQFAPRGPVQFYNAGGTFYTGYDPLRPGETFRGTLDEVIFDPPDGGRPPLFAQDQILVFVPAVVKQP